MKRAVKQINESMMPFDTQLKIVLDFLHNNSTFTW